MQPLIEKLSPAPPPLDTFEGLKDRPFCFFLDSAMDPLKLGRFSFMGSAPFLVLRSRGRTTMIDGPGGRQVLQGNPFDILGTVLDRYATQDTGPVPFLGGAVGYFSYDLCHFIERLPSLAVDDLQLPECYLALYDVVIGYDLLEGSAYLVSTGFPETGGLARADRAGRRMAELKALASRPPPMTFSTDSLRTTPAAEGLKSNFTHDEYLRAVSRAREYIIAGDIFQVNLSQRFEARLDIQAHELYRKVRAINPAPFGGYLGFDGVNVVSCSPERFLQLRGKEVETRPVKGTRPRGQTPFEDGLLAAELGSSIKDRAENIMIVDLERNDLGRVCEYGSVRVVEKAILETYPTVFHLTSTVVGKLRQDKNYIDLLKATFPGGSITGAPKVRAMEIIDELEPTKRSVYTGSIGYLGFNGDIDLNIAIRTFLVKGNRAYFQAGGGIVYDSEPEAEYLETLDKARALFEALGLAPVIASAAKQSRLGAVNLGNATMR